MSSLLGRQCKLQAMFGIKALLKLEFEENISVFFFVDIYLKTSDCAFLFFLCTFYSDSTAW